MSNRDTICEHGIRWPWACHECDDAAWAAHKAALATAASGGDVEQAPGEAPQSGGDSRNAQPPSDRIEQLNQGGSND